MNNVLPSHFAPSQASLSQNSNVDSQYCDVESLKPSHLYHHARSFEFDFLRQIALPSEPFYWLSSQPQLFWQVSWKIVEKFEYIS